jgi:hypothetical protein
MLARHLAEQAPSLFRHFCDALAPATALVGGVMTLLGVVQSVVVIAATLAGGAYSIYRLYDLYDQRRLRKKAGK